MDFYKILLSIMEKKDLSIPDVSRATGIPDSTIRSIISRKTKNISLEVAFKFSKGLDISLEELNGEVPYPHNYKINNLSEINSNNTILSPDKMKLISDLENMSEDEILAVKAFIQSLNNFKKNVKK